MLEQKSDGALPLGEMTEERTAWVSQIIVGVPASPWVAPVYLQAVSSIPRLGPEGSESMLSSLCLSLSSY